MNAKQWKHTSAVMGLAVVMYTAYTLPGLHAARHHRA